METSPVDKTVTEGADFVEFNCTVALTMPVPTVSWIFTNSDGHVQTVQEQVHGQVLLEYLQFQGTKVAVMIVFLRMNLTKSIHQHI